MSHSLYSKLLLPVIEGIKVKSYLVISISIFSYCEILTLILCSTIGQLLRCLSLVGGFCK